ncbi:MAG: hypothetical protein IJX17_08945 [Clostridia bacterium]|nr:hypothetical protein [Clostridia bacterium]MBQ8426122.1 hypothetical protein [Clostridia bacterium]
MGIIRDSFVMFKNWSEAIEALPEEYQLETYKALSKYGLTGEMPEDISPVTKAILISFSKGMENNIARYNASVENGKKGGRPKKEQPSEENEQPSCENENLEKPRKTQENLTEPNHNLNVNVNVNDSVNVNENGNDNEFKLVNKLKKINCFESYDITHTCARVPEKSQEERWPYLSYYKEFFDWQFGDTIWRQLGLEIVDTMVEAKQQAETEEGLKFNQKRYFLYDICQMFAKVDCDHFRSIITQLRFNDEIRNRPTYILGCLERASCDKFNKTTQEEMKKFIEDLEKQS